MTDNDVREFTNKEVTDATNKVVNERGHDYVYTTPEGWMAPDVDSCKYRFNVDGRITPGCIVGAVVYELDKDMLFSLEEGAYVSGQPLEVVSRFSVESLQALMSAQLEQDRGHTWGEALEAFHEDMERN